MNPPPSEEEPPPPEPAGVRTFAPADGEVASDRRNLSLIASWGLVALMAYGMYRGWKLPPERLFAGMGIIFLACWPALRWIRLQPYPFPAFETFMLTGVSAYALPLLTDHALVSAYPGEVVLDASLAVLLFQACAILAYLGTQAHERSSPFWTEPLFTRDISAWLPAGLWLNLAYVLVSQFTTLLPADINSILRAVFFGVNTACSFLLGRKWGAGELSPGGKASLIAVVSIQAFVQASSLFLIVPITGLLVLLLAYVSAGRRIPVVGLALLFAVFTLLHNGKAPMREKYWNNEAAPKIELWDLPAFYSEWISHSLDRPLDEFGAETQRKNLIDRASLLQMLCLVVEHTEYLGADKLGGETYANVPAQLVPRFFWPGKPSGQETTRRLGTYFGLQDIESASTTSIGFGVLAEAFANFGYWGLAALGALIGWANKLIAIWTRSAPLLSNGGFIMILLMAWAVQVELPMSNWVASLYQAAICVLGIPYVLRRLLG